MPRPASGSRHPTERAQRGCAQRARNALQALVDQGERLPCRIHQEGRLTNSMAMTMPAMFSVK
jgi:hypothetical protein